MRDPSEIVVCNEYIINIYNTILFVSIQNHVLKEFYYFSKKKIISLKKHIWIWKKKVGIYLSLNKIKYHEYLIKITKYLQSKDVIWLGSQMSKWIIENGVTYFF